MQGKQASVISYLSLTCPLPQVFLQHLQSLASLPTFTALWLTILDLLGQFCARYWSSGLAVQ